MGCLLPPLTTIPHGTWTFPLCIPHHLLPRTVTRPLRLPFPIVDFDSDENISKKNDSLSLICVSRLPITICQNKMYFHTLPQELLIQSVVCSSVL